VVSEFEVLVTLVGSVVEPIECSSASRRQFVDLIGFFDERNLSHALAEVALVDAFAENGFIEHLQLSECEEGREELESYGSLGYALAQHPQGLAYHFGVVKQEWGQQGDILPIGRVLAIKFLVHVGDVQKCGVGHGDHAVAGVAVYATESTHLFHIDFFQARQFRQDAGCGIIDVFILPDKTTHKRPFAGMRFEGPLL